MPPPAELGGSQISSLLEALPGIASVLRSPVADALVRAIRGAAGLGEFSVEDAEELVRYAVRRGLIGPEEGDRGRGEARGGRGSGGGGGGGGGSGGAKRKAARGAKPKPAAKKSGKKKKNHR